MTNNEIPHWDVSSVYPGLESEELKDAFHALRAGLDDLDRYLDDHDIRQAGRFTSGRDAAAGEQALASTIAGYLDRMNANLRLGGTLRAYLHAFVSTDSYNNLARRLASELEPLEVRIHQQEVRFQGWIGSLTATAPQLFQAVLDTPGPVRDHRFYLEETAEQSRYLMSEAEEGLASELSLSGARAWSKLQGVITSQLKVPFDPGTGQVQELPITKLQNLSHDPDEDVRRRAYEAELAAWESVREPLAACLNGVKGAVQTLNGRRGREDALHEALDQARIDRDILNTMLGAMHDSFPAFRRYFHAKARLLGKDRLAWWDLSAPTSTTERHFSFGEARDFILDQFATFSPRLQGLARRAFDERWIDAEPRTGKRGGAFCMNVPAVEESRILCNFDGSLDQVLTIAHELGHAYHNECKAGITMLQGRTPMTLAETASIMNETIITDALLARSTDPDETRAILESDLIGATGVIVDIYSRYLFETEVFERRTQAELSADELNDIMIRAQKETYGDGLDERFMNPYMWTWKPHYYRPNLSFYNFPYAFGLLFGLGLYAIYRERGQAFLSQYDDLLRSTGTGNAADLAARFGIDLRRRDFWTGSLGVIEERIEQYRAL
ncbi:MAG TPA: M3 family oligoendopeptidase [Anaerolineae bacterium]|nr:M3 family oligoendopeptidase [Anaerolineae bacterium]